MTTIESVESTDGDPSGAAAAIDPSFRVTGCGFTLRYATLDDAEALYGLASDPAVTRFFSWGPYTAPDEPVAYINSLAGKRERGELLEFVIADADDRPVGVTGLTEFSLRDRRAVVGSWLGHRHWGAGVNRASKVLVLALGFERLGLQRISAYSHVRNGRSENALERIGFNREGVLRAWHMHHGEPQDVTIHCMLKDHYLRSGLCEEAVEFHGSPPPAFVIN